jgi:hypothetical protein
MIVVGGTNPQSNQPFNVWPNGLGVFDMTSLQWTNAYDVDAKPYDQPDVVKQYYNQRYSLTEIHYALLAADPTFRTSGRYPATWDIPALGTIFGMQLVPVGA